MRGRRYTPPSPQWRLPFSSVQTRILVVILIIVAVWVFRQAPERYIGRVIGLLLGFTLHEWAHAYTALRLGDRTAYNQGRVTLDPRAHIDAIGAVLALTVGFGWARPVPVNPRAFYPNERQGLLIVSIAGPLMNLLIAMVFGIVFRLINVAMPHETAGSLVRFFYEIWQWIIILNVALFFFNLIPLSPLDGWKIMLGLVPPRTAYDLERYEQQSTIILILILTLGIVNENFNIVWQILGPPVNSLTRLFMGL